MYTYELTLTMKFQAPDDSTAKEMVDAVKIGVGSLNTTSVDVKLVATGYPDSTGRVVYSGTT